MKLAEYVDQVSYLLGLTDSDVEDVPVDKAVLISFQEVKRYIRTPARRTIPFSYRAKLSDVGIITQKVLYVQAAQPRIGLTLSSIDAGNVFQVAAAVGTFGGVGNSSVINVDPIITEMALAQVRNTISTDFQWTYDRENDLLYCTHRDPIPTQITVTYVPDFQDVSEIEDPVWINYILRFAEANAKKARGRARSKYTVEGSNVSLDGEQLVNEANEELNNLRTELASKKSKFTVLN